MRCHYIPQFYLNHFSISGKPGYIFAYRRNKRVFETKARNVAAKNDLYIFTDKRTGRKSDELEKMFSWLEGLTAPLIQKINSGASLSELKNKDHNVLAEFISYLHVRNLGFRERQKNLANTLLVTQLKILAQNEKEFKKVFVKTKHATKDVDKMREYALNFEKHFKIDWGKKNDDYFLKQSLLLALEISPIIFYKEWHILDNKTSRVFITSDNPVILIRPQGLPPFYGLGIANSHIVVPTSPNKALLLRTTNKRAEDPKIINVNRGFVETINRHTMFYAHKFVYSNLLLKDIQKDFDTTQDGRSERVVIG